MNFLKLITGIVILMLTTVSCKSKTPSELGQEICKCYSQIREIQNESAKFRKIEECGNRQTINSRMLQKMGEKNDWNSAEVANAEAEFRRSWEYCN